MDAVAAIHQQLDVGFLPREQVPCIVSRHNQIKQDGALIDGQVGGFVAVHNGKNLKISGSAKLIDQLAALRRVVLIVDVGGNSIHVQSESVAEQQQHHQRQRQRQRQAADIAHNVQQFLPGDGPQPAQAHAAFLSSCSIMATKTSSMDGSIGSRTVISIPAS
jgi:hypothetical protein